MFNVMAAAVVDMRQSSVFCDLYVTLVRAGRLTERLSVARPVSK